MNDKVVVTFPDTGTPMQIRKTIEQFEQEAMGLPQVHTELFELRVGNAYVRALVIPAGTALTGKVHKHDCINILARGVIEVWTEREGARILSGFEMFKSEKGSKRLGITHTQVVWINVFSVDGGIPDAEVMDFISSANYLEEVG